MKIEIYRQTSELFAVFNPNWIERLFGFKNKIIFIKESEDQYWLNMAGDRRKMFIMKDGTGVRPNSKLQSKLENFMRSW